MLGGLWGFPSERRNDDETAAGTARRAAAAQGGVAIAEEHELFRIRHVYTHFRITVRVFACTPAPGAPANPPLLPIKWVTAAELRLLPLSKVDIKILAGLMAAGAKA